jgi:hypothetical protein
MTLRLETRHDLTPTELDAIEERLSANAIVMQPDAMMRKVWVL